MEKPPSILKAEDQEKEISPEKRSRLRERLKDFVVAGMIALGAAGAVKEGVGVYNSMAIENVTDITEPNPQNANEAEEVHYKVQTKDGKIYDLHFVTHVDSTKAGYSRSSGMLDWNTAYVSSKNPDGFSTKIKFDMTRRLLEPAGKGEKLSFGGGLKIVETKEVYDKSGNSMGESAIAFIAIPDNPEK